MSYQLLVAFLSLKNKVQVSYVIQCVLIISIHHYLFPAPSSAPTLTSFPTLGLFLKVVVINYLLSSISVTYFYKCVMPSLEGGGGQTINSHIPKREQLLSFCSHRLPVIPLLRVCLYCNFDYKSYLL